MSERCHQYAVIFSRKAGLTMATAHKLMVKAGFDYTTAVISPEQLVFRGELWAVPQQPSEVVIDVEEVKP